VYDLRDSMDEKRQLGRLAKSLLVLGASVVIVLAVALATAGRRLALDHRVRALLAETAPSTTFDGMAWNGDSAGLFRHVGKTEMLPGERWYGAPPGKQDLEAHLAFLPESKRTLVDRGASAGSRVLPLENVIVFSHCGIALVESDRVFTDGPGGFFDAGTLAEVKARVLLVRELRRAFDAAAASGRVDLLELCVRSPCSVAAWDAGVALSEQGERALPVFRRFLDDEKLRESHYIVLERMRWNMECPGLGAELVHALEHELAVVEALDPGRRASRIHNGNTALALFGLARIRYKGCRDPLPRVRALLATIDYDRDTYVKQGLAEVERMLESP